MGENDNFIERPWGKYTKFYQESAVWVKRVEVNVNGRLSLQRHNKRSEKWIIVKGQGLAILDGVQYDMSPGAVLDVPIGSNHRIGNSGNEPLVFIEVACGEYLGEDDIVRIEDDYRRSE